MPARLRHRVRTDTENCFVTWIKICGTTNLADAIEAVEAGADALGFVFAESTRRVTPETAAEITCHLPANVEKIGVFISETPERIRAIAEQVGLTAVQLHQHVAIPGLGDVGRIPVLHMTDLDQFEREGEPFRFDDSVERILLDSGSAVKGGGTGKCFDWQRAQHILNSYKIADRFRIIVAGGLGPENVGQAIRIFQPFGVDVVSGVEREKGKKDPDKVRAFIAAVRAAENGLKMAEKAQP
jgi:phosphoribosylanthranilate isomerase